MNELTCGIIRDILPLYADEAVCEETKEAVRSHLSYCEACRKELEIISTKLQPIQNGDAEKSIKTLKRRWGFRQLIKGAAITLAALSVAVGSLGYIYVFGLPVSSEKADLRTGFQCGVKMKVREDADRKVIYEEIVSENNPALQEWILDIEYQSGGIRTETEFEYGDEIVNGEAVPVSMTVYMKKALFVMPWDNSDRKLRMGYSWPEEIEITEDSDFTVNLVFSDKTVTYSMREEGLFEEQEHTSEFCPFCGK